MPVKYVKSRNLSYHLLSALLSAYYSDFVEGSGPMTRIGVVPENSMD